MGTRIEYRGFIIQNNPPEARQYKYGYYHKDYDGYEDNRRGDCLTLDDCKEEIDQYWQQCEDEFECSIMND